MQIPQWTVFETQWEAARDYDNPLWDVTPRVAFTSPSGKTQTIDAFYDGRRTWRARFCPDEVGEWQYEVSASEAGRQGRQGRV